MGEGGQGGSGEYAHWNNPKAAPPANSVYWNQREKSREIGKKRQRGITPRVPVSRENHRPDQLGPVRPGHVGLWNPYTVLLFPPVVLQGQDGDRGQEHDMDSSEERDRDRQ